MKVATASFPPPYPPPTGHRVFPMSYQGKQLGNTRVAGGGEHRPHRTPSPAAAHLTLRPRPRSAIISSASPSPSSGAIRSRVA